MSDVKEKDDEFVEFFRNLGPSALRADAGKFEAKLTFAERCAVLACHVNGVSRPTLALAFGINRRTVTHIYNAKSPHYRSVRQEYERLGKADFTKQYFTEDIQKRLTDVANHFKNRDLLRASDETASEYGEDLIKPAKMRAKHRGFHVIHPEQCKVTHRIEIDWVNSYHGEGWYFRDLDGPNPEEWMNNGPESIMTSTTAYKGAMLEVVDRM